jgi:hypothetical protein
MKRIKLMADYHCFPLWEAGEGCFGNIDPNDLPISTALIEDLSLWARKYDDTLNEDAPNKSGFENSDLESMFFDMGRDLLDRLRFELDGKYEVEYFFRKDDAT